MYAVVTTGGKQYRVEAGNELTIERVPGDAGSTITFDRVLLVGDGDDVTVGTPTVSGATVSGTVLGEALGPKLTVFKFKQKVKYRRMAGHRQHLVRVRIDEISASGRKAKAEADKPAAAKVADPEPAADATEAEREAKPKRTRSTTGTAKAATTKARATKADDEKAAADSTGADTEAKPKRGRRTTKAKTEE